MENKLEQLLNSLIEKGWKPFNKDIREFFTLNEFTCGYRGEGTNHLGTIRDIVSKESGLWQFVCKNGMVEHRNYWVDTEIGQDEQYKYRVIESSLKDESELEDFLLSNIKVGNEQL